MKIIVASTNHAKLIAALELAMSLAALGQEPQLFLQGEAANLIALPLACTEDTKRSQHGLPNLAQILEEAAAMDIPITACQTGLLMASIASDAIWPQARIGGLIGFLSPSDSAPIVY